MITLPIKISFKDWVYCITIDLQNFSIPLPTEEKDWKEWVNSLISLNPSINIPLPKIVIYSSEDKWREWANCFIETVSSTITYSSIQN